MRCNWYIAVRKTSLPDSWRCLIGPYKTKREADAMELTAKMLFDRYQADAATLELRGLTWGTLAMPTEYSVPGLLNGKLP